MPGQQPPYPQERRDEINLALAEARAWLIAQGLLVHTPQDSAGGHDWRVLSRRAHRFEDDAEFVRYATARKLQKETLHPRISNKVWSAFMRGEFEVAVCQAMKAVEVGARPFGLIEEAGGRIDHSDSQTFAFSLSYTNSLQFTTLYTLPHGLPRHGESTHGLRYRNVVRRCSVHQQLA